MLHEDMLQSLMELPEQYDFGAYSHFISEYGTHYVTQGIMGGILDYIVVINKEVMERRGKEWLTVVLLVKDIQTPKTEIQLHKFAILNSINNWVIP